MTDKAKALLEKMADEYDSSKQNSFDSMFYISYPDDVLTELCNYGYITMENNIKGTIELTNAGYAKARG